MRVAASGLAVVVLATVLAGCGSSEPELLPVPSGLPSSTTTALVPLRAAGFRISFPAAATPYEQHVVLRGQPTTVGGYKSSDLAGGYFLVNQLPNPTSAPIDLDGLVSASVGAVGGTLRSSRAVTFRGHPGRDVSYAVNLAGTDLTFFVLALDVDNSLFQLQYAIPQKDAAQRPALFDQVLATLRFR
jgi:hypothetical protein